MTINKHTIGLNETSTSGAFLFPFFFFTKQAAVFTFVITIAIVNQRLDAPFSSAGFALSVASYDINVIRANAVVYCHRIYARPRDIVTRMVTVGRYHCRCA